MFNNELKSIVSISTDRNLFKTEAKVFKRHSDYANILNQTIHIIVFTRKGYSIVRSRNIVIYPTNSISKLTYIFDAYKLGQKIIKDNNINLISAQDPFETGLVAYFLSLRLNRCLHLQIHTDLFNKYFKKYLLNRLRCLVAKIIIPRATGLRVVSQRILDSLNSNFNSSIITNNIVVLPIFIDFCFFLDYDSNLKENRFFKKNIIWVGRFEREKNPGLALEVMNVIRQRNKEVGLIMIGDGRLKSKLKSRLKYNPDLSQRIVLKTWQDDIRPWLKSSDIYLSTSWYEGYGLSQLEAVLLNLPLVSTDAGLAGNIFKNNKEAKICKPGDNKCLARSILQLLEDKNLTDDLVNRAKLKSRQLKSDYLEFLELYKYNIVNSIR
ncbi:MAG: glycosyltransferase [Patescibacteria group bacterium]